MLAFLDTYVPSSWAIYVSIFVISLPVSFFYHGFIFCQLLIFSVGLGYLKVFVPPEKVLRWIEGKLNLLGRLPHYVSVDQKTFGRYGVLPTNNAAGVAGSQVPMSYLGSTQRLGSNPA